MYELANITLAAGDTGKTIAIAVLILVGLVAFVAFLLFMKFASLWLQAYFSRADVKLSELVGMWLRKVDARQIVVSKITAIQAGLELLEQSSDGRVGLVRGIGAGVADRLLGVEHEAVLRELKLLVPVRLFLMGRPLEMIGQDRR